MGKVSKVFERRKAMIEYLDGDATKPELIRPDVDEVKYIVHGCNNIKKWGKGFVLAISKRWKEPRRRFMQWDSQLGEIQLVPVEDDVVVGNMITQHHIYPQNGIPPIRYEAVDRCFARLSEELSQRHPEGDCSVHMPRIGCGLAKGRWGHIQPSIESHLENFDVFVYDYN